MGVFAALDLTRQTGEYALPALQRSTAQDTFAPGGANPYQPREATQTVYIKSNDNDDIINNFSSEDVQALE